MKRSRRIRITIEDPAPEDLELLSELAGSAVRGGGEDDDVDDEPDDGDADDDDGDDDDENDDDSE